MILNLNNLLRMLITPALITTLATNSMEIISLKNSSEEVHWVDNRLFTSQNYERTKAFLKENSTFKITNSSEITSLKKPSIEAKLFIDHRKFTTRYYDAQSNYCKIMKNAGIPLPQDTQTISMIPVIVIDTNDGIHWVNEVPYAIQNYERTQAFLDENLTLKEQEQHLKYISKQRVLDPVVTDHLYDAVKSYERTHAFRKKRLTIEEQKQRVQCTAEKTFPYPVQIDLLIDTIQTYNRIQAVLKKNVTIEQQKPSRCISKIFPNSIPIDLLWEHKTGDIIELTVHGYPTRLICSDNPLCNLPFKDHFLTNINEPFDGILLDNIDSHHLNCLLYTEEILELLEDMEKYP